MTLHTTAEKASAQRTPAREVTAELADFFSREIKALRDFTEKELAQLSQKIEKLSIAPDEAAELSKKIAGLNALLSQNTARSSAGRIQLVDIVRNALPAGRYTFSQKLDTGRTVDCLILPATPNRSAIAIDARYPVEAYDDYVRAGMDASEKATNDYRRTILRHIANIAETAISTGETEDFAIMFAPSEAIFNDLHANFSDVVQDSYRARVWILSPTSMMASLHMMSTIAGEREATPAVKPSTADNILAGNDVIESHADNIATKTNKDLDSKLTHEKRTDQELSTQGLHSKAIPEKFKTDAHDRDDQESKTKNPDTSGEQDVNAEESSDATHEDLPPFPLR